MELKITLSDEAVAAYLSKGIDPQKDLEARVNSFVGIARREREKNSVQPLAAKMVQLSDADLAEVATLVESKIPKVVADPALRADAIEAGDPQ